MNEQICDYIVNNHEALKEQIKPYQNKYIDLLKTEPAILKNDIDQQFFYMVKLILVDNVTKALGVSTEEAYIVVESINITEFLK